MTFSKTTNGMRAGNSARKPFVGKGSSLRVSEYAGKSMRACPHLPANRPQTFNTEGSNTWVTGLRSTRKLPANTRMRFAPSLGRERRGGKREKKAKNGDGETVVEPVFDEGGEMKVYKLVRESAVQTILSPSDAERMLLTGDWLIAKQRPKTKMAARMRELNNRRRGEGWTTRTLWFNPMDLAAVRAALLPGETYAELFLRLVRKNSLL